MTRYFYRLIDIGNMPAEEIGLYYTYIVFDGIVYECGE